MRYDGIARDYREYRALASELLGYIDTCAEKGVAPLRYDANVFRARLRAVDGKRRREMYGR